jgi:hypothetical protein
VSLARWFLEQPPTYLKTCGVTDVSMGFERRERAHVNG